MTPRPTKSSLIRCPWADEEPLRSYHDLEWGVPLHGDQQLFELLSLEGAQAGLSWRTVLVRRDAYRKAFFDFDLERVATLSKHDVDVLVVDATLIRHRGKIESVIANAQEIQRIQERDGSFDTYLWRFVDARPIVHKFSSLGELPAQSELSKSLSKDLKANGLRFVGPTICYSFLQAAGLVMDHLTTCPRWQDLC